LVVAGGPVAIAVPVLAIIALWRPNWMPWIAFGAMLVAGVFTASASNHAAIGSGPFSGPAQLFALLALAAALMPAVGGVRGSARRAGREYK
jgi:arabinofuranan 3-O-arabinosyltransferase